MRDTKEILMCPACGKEMQKIFLEEQNFNVDICLDGCGGIFLDNRELKKIDETDELAAAIYEAMEDREFKKTDETEIRICPVCDSVMVKNKSRYSKDIEVDECYSCGGVFLDNNELFKIREKSADEEAAKAEFEEELAKKLRMFFEES